MTRQDFVQYLEDTLIPGLIESGMTATAADFKTAVCFIEDPEVAAVDREQIDAEVEQELSVWERQLRSDRDKEDGLY